MYVLLANFSDFSEFYKVHAVDELRVSHPAQLPTPPSGSLTRGYGSNFWCIR